MLPLQYVILHWPCPVSYTDVHITTIETISLAFCCFLLLALALGVGCVYKMFDCYQGVCVHVCLKSTDRKCVTEFILNVLTSHFFHSS